MPRFYVSPVIGTGTRDDPYRPSVASVATSWSCVLASNQDGTPARSFALVLADVPAGAKLPDGVLALPDVALDTPVSALSLTQQAVVNAALMAAGVAHSLSLSTSTLRDVVTVIGQRHTLNFNTDQLRA